MPSDPAYFFVGGAYWFLPAVAQNMQPDCNFGRKKRQEMRTLRYPGGSTGMYEACCPINSRHVGAALKSPKEYAMSGANRPSGPATRKSLDLADQIERDELENNLPDALNHADEDDLDDEPDTGKPRR